MWDHAAGQIEAIHSMMATGHRSVSLERHTLYIWGITAALLILLVRQIFTPELLPVDWQRTFSANLFIATVLTLIGIWDLRLTRRAREARDETLSFIQLQLTKAWWGIIALIVLINIGMNFFGGGYLFYPIMVALVGLAFFIHGLFSQQLLSWVGMLMVLLGLFSMAMRFSFMTLEWMTVVIFGIGFPVLAWLLSWRPQRLQKNYRLIFSVIWLSFIAVPTYALDRLNQHHAAPAVPIESLQHFRTQGDSPLPTHIVRLAAGTSVPVQVRIHSDVLAGDTTSTIPLLLAQPLDIVLEAGKPNGQYRVAEGKWNDRRHKFRVQNVKIDSTLTREDGPGVSVSFDIETAH